MPTNKVQYWIELADYDFETAIAMQQTKRWLYVGFMCHQVIEKSIKAYWNSVKEEDAPYIHNPKRIAEACGLYAQMTETQKSFLDTIAPLNIEARYPSYKEQLAEALTPEYCAEIIENTKNLLLWIKSRL